MHLLHHTKFWSATLLLSAGAIFTSCNTSQTKSPLRITSSFEEMPDPQCDEAAQWSDNSKGFNVSFVSTNSKFAKSQEPCITLEDNIKLTGWRNEKVHAEILVWSKDSIADIECQLSNFVSANSKLDADIAKVSFVRYVMTDEFAGGCGYRQPEDFIARLSQDMLDPITTMDMTPQTVRPLWISIDIPKAAPTGLYRAEVTITSKNNEAKKLHLDLDVQDATLSDASQWTYHLDLWQHPSAVARTEGLKMWSDEHFEALKAPMTMLAKAGQKVITATLNKDPWNNQCFDPYADMITWTKHSDGKWSYNYEVFDRWVTLMMGLGIDKMINCYSVVPWNNEIHYFDEATDTLVNIKADPGTEVFNEVWHHFFKDFKGHLSERGWLEITNVAMDERTPKEMEATIKMLQKEAPELGIAYADNQKSYKKYPFVKDISIAASATIDPKDLAERQKNGLITTYYVCCSDAFPNMFTFSAPGESVYAGWYALAMNLDGFLRWAYNSWVENPLTDSRFRTWPAGDTYMIYPEAKSSIRFEKLIEGIQDVEKVKALRETLASKENNEAKEALEELNRTVSNFATIKPEEDYKEMLSQAKETLNRITLIAVSN